MKSLHFLLLSTLTTCFLATSVDAILCHVCESTSATDPSCTDTDLGAVQDGCVSCGALKLDTNRFRRLCLDESKGNACELQRGLQVCACNTTLCNAKHIFQPVISCYECEFKSDRDTETCTEKKFGKKVDKCLSCYTIKMKDNRFMRGCMKAITAVGCTVDGSTRCYCDKELCNGKYSDIKTMKCYVCKPRTENDRSCEVVNSVSEQDGCLTCGRSVNENGITTRFCLDHAVRPSTSRVDGKTMSYCSVNLCNGGEEEEQVVVVRSIGLQKTVSSRVLIGGVLLAMQSLSRFF